MMIETSFQIVNGFCGMKRDVILRLCILMKNPQNIREVMGMCEEHFSWKNRSYFLNGRKKHFLLGDFMPTPSSCLVSRISAGVNCAFLTAKTWQTMFLNARICNSIWRWEVQIEYGGMYGHKSSSFWMGTAPSNQKEFKYGEYLGCLSHRGSASLGVWKGVQHIFCGDEYFGSEFVNSTRLYGVNNTKENTSNYLDEKNSVVAAEVDANARTVIYFFKNEVYFSNYIKAVSDISVPLRIGMTVYTRSTEASFISLSFRRLSAPTPIPGVPYACCLQPKDKKPKKRK